MAASLLRGEPDDDARMARRWWILPLSIAAHAAAAAAAIVIPLAAYEEAPRIPPVSRPYMKVTQAVPADLPAPRAAAGRTGTPAPTTAPTSIQREVDPMPLSRAAGEGPALAGTPGVHDGVDGGLGASIGSAVVTPALPPVPPPPPPRPVRVGHGISAPRKLVHIDPVYPAIARTSRVEGLVILEAVISERGVVEQVRVLRSEPLLDRAAIDAVSAWRYTPTLLNGVPVPVLMTITVKFSLQE